MERNLRRPERLDYLGYFKRRRGNGGEEEEEPTDSLENRQSGGGQSADIDILRVRGSVQRRFGGTAVYLGQRVLQKLNGGQDLKQEKQNDNKNA